MALSHDQPQRHYLKEWRKHRGLSCAQLEKLAGCGSGVISRYETGKRRIHLEVQYKLLGALNITPMQFYSPPDRPSLDAMVAGESPETVSRIGKLVKAFLGRDDT